MIGIFKFQIADVLVADGLADGVSGDAFFGFLDVGVVGELVFALALEFGGDVDDEASDLTFVVGTVVANEGLAVDVETDVGDVGDGSDGVPAHADDVFVLGDVDHAELATVDGSGEALEGGNK